MKRFIAVLAATCGSLLAADHLNLEEGLPTELEDAYPSLIADGKFKRT